MTKFLLWIKRILLIHKKKRPVLTLTQSPILKYLAKVTVAPIKATVRDIPTKVFLSKADGMIHDCAINCGHILSVSPLETGGEYSFKDHRESYKI